MQWVQGASFGTCYSRLQLNARRPSLYVQLVHNVHVECVRNACTCGRSYTVTQCDGSSVCDKLSMLFEEMITCKLFENEISKNYKR